jgi:hypothetical protein
LLNESEHNDYPGLRQGGVHGNAHPVAREAGRR